MKLDYIYYYQIVGKNLAREFKKELFSYIIPQIRKTGSYNIHKTDKDKLKKLNDKLHQLEKSNKNLKDNQKKLYIQLVLRYIL